MSITYGVPGSWGGKRRENCLWKIFHIVASAPKMGNSVLSSSKRKSERKKLTFFLIQYDILIICSVVFLIDPYTGCICTTSLWLLIWLFFLNNLAALLMHCFMNNYTHVWNKIILLLKILCLDKFFIVLSPPGPPPPLICLQNQLLFIQQECLRWRHCKMPWQRFCLSLLYQDQVKKPEFILGKPQDST